MPLPGICTFAFQKKGSLLSLLEKTPDDSPVFIHQSVFHPPKCRETDYFSLSFTHSVSGGSADFAKELSLGGQLRYSKSRILTEKTSIFIMVFDLEIEKEFFLFP